MSDMVTALRAQGLIERFRDPEDRRRLVLALTPDGQAMLNRFRGQVDALEKEMLAGLTSTQARQLRTSLLSCRTALSGTNAH